VIGFELSCVLVFCLCHLTSLLTPIHLEFTFDCSIKCLSCWSSSGALSAWVHWCPAVFGGQVSSPSVGVTWSLESFGWCFRWWIRLRSPLEIQVLAVPFLGASASQVFFGGLLLGASVGQVFLSSPELSGIHGDHSLSDIPRPASTGSGYSTLIVTFGDLLGIVLP
jgi:hypothetical protein